MGGGVDFKFKLLKEKNKSTKALLIEKEKSNGLALDLLALSNNRRLENLERDTDRLKIWQSKMEGKASISVIISGVSIVVAVVTLILNHFK